jgi:carbon monoxide dehydrogenase subunit G
MKLSGTQIIPASREIVWKGLNDPAVLKQCIPGCETITQNSPTELSATVVAKVGPVRASFNGAVTLSDIKAPESYRISGQGQGGLAGFASGGADVRLTVLGPNETQMDYDVDAQIGGKMAMLGSRLIGSAASSLADQFFSKFASLMKAQGASAKPAVAKAAPAKKSVLKKPAAKKAVKKVAAKKAKRK